MAARPRRTPLPPAALLALLPLALASAVLAAEQTSPNSTQWRAPVAERRGWVPLKRPCPTCRSATDNSPQGSAVVGRAVPPPQFNPIQQLPPPQFAPPQQLPPPPQQQQSFLQPFQQQLLLNQLSQGPFASIPLLPGSLPAPDQNLYVLRQQPQPTVGPSALPEVPTREPLTPPPPPQQNQPREEVQLLYVPVEALRPRGRIQNGPPRQLQPQFQFPPPSQPQTLAPLLPPAPTTSSTTSTSTTTTTTTASTTLAAASSTAAPLATRHRFRQAGNPPPQQLTQADRSRYLEQALPPPSPSPSPTATPTPSAPTTLAPHQPPLSIFVERRPVGRTRILDVISALNGSPSIAVMDEAGPDAPSVFVGPANLPPPPGFAKFELPYLSTLMTASRGERRIDRIPFFVAPLSFRPPPGFSKIPFPAPHVGSVVVANSTHPTQPPNPPPSTAPSTTPHTPVSSPVGLPADLPAISAELPALVNSLQDNRGTGDVLLLPQTPKPQQQFPAQQKFPTQQQFVPQQQFYRNQQTEDFQQEQRFVQQPHLNRHQQQHRPREPQSEEEARLQEPDLLQQNRQVLQQQLYQQQTVQTVAPRPLQEHTTRAPQQQNTFLPNVDDYQTHYVRHPTPVHEERFPVTEAIDTNDDQGLNGDASLEQQYDEVPPETTTTTTTSTTTTQASRRPAFRGRLRASQALTSTTESAPRRPSSSRRRPHPSRVRTNDDNTSDYSRQQHRFRGRGSARQTTTPLYSSSSDPTTPLETTPGYQPDYSPIGETTPTYQQFYSPGADTNFQQSAYNSPGEEAPNYPQTFFRQVTETTPSYARPSPSPGEDTTEPQITAEPNVQYQQPPFRGAQHAATPAEYNGDLNQGSLRSTQVYQQPQQYSDVGEETPADVPQYADGGRYRSPGYEAGIQETTPVDAPPQLLGDEHSSTTETSSTTTTTLHPTTSFQRTRGRRPHHQSKHQTTDGDGPSTQRPTNVRLRGRVRASTRPRPPPEPENYPPNFHDAAVFDATRRPAGNDYSYESVSTSTEAATTRAARVRTNFLPRRPASSSTTETPSTPSDNKVYTVRPTRRPGTTPTTKLTSARGRIRRPTQPPKTTTSTTTTSTTPAYSSPVYHSNEVGQQGGAPDYFDYYSAEPAQDSPSSLPPEFRRPAGAGFPFYQDDDPEAGGAETQWNRNKWRQQGHPNALPTAVGAFFEDTTFDFLGENAPEDQGNGTEPVNVSAGLTTPPPPPEAIQNDATTSTTTPSPPSSTTAAPSTTTSTTTTTTTTTPSPPPQTQAPTTSTTTTTTTTPAPEPTSSTISPIPAATPSPDIFSDVTATGLDASTAPSGPEVEDSSTTGPDNRRRRLKVRVRARVQPRDMLEPAESQHLATVANALPAAATKSNPDPSTPSPDLLYDTTPAPQTDTVNEATVPPYRPTVPPIPPSPVYTPKDAVPETTPVVLNANDIPETTPSPDLTYTGYDFDDVTSAPSAEEDEDDEVDDEDDDEEEEEEDDQWSGPDDEEYLSPTTQAPPTTKPTAASTTTTTTSTTTTPAPPPLPPAQKVNFTAFPATEASLTDPAFVTDPAMALFGDIQRVRVQGARRPPEVRLIGTSTTTEVSHETEICYRGRCVKTKTKSKPDAKQSLS